MLINAKTNLQADQDKYKESPTGPKACVVSLMQNLWPVKTAVTPSLLSYKARKSVSGFVMGYVSDGPPTLKCKNGSSEDLMVLAISMKRKQNTLEFSITGSLSIYISVSEIPFQLGIVIATLI